MRSAERLSIALAALGAAATLVGCDSVGPVSRDAPPAAHAASAAASTPAAAASAAAPIAPATQRAYDDALALLRAGRSADAERALRALTRSDPDLAGPHANLGLIARNGGRLPEAVAELERATTLAPGLAVAWNQLGLAYRQSGEFTKARDAYEHALAADPGYAAAALNLGVLEDLYLAEPARALDAYTRYLALTPGGDPAVAKWVAEVQHRLPKSAAPAASAASSTDAAKETP